MIKHSITSLCAAVTIVALSACETIEVDTFDYEECTPNVAGTPNDPVVIRQFVDSLPPDGSTAAVILDDGTALENAVVALGGSGPNLRAKIQSAKNGPKASGLGGISTRSFLRAADHTLDGNNYGHQIKDFSVVGRLEAYSYDPSGGSCLRVRMTYSVERENGEGLTFAYRWTVFVRDLLDEPRTGSGSNVFPGAMTLPISAAMAGTYDHKLWAINTVDDPDNIRVTRVELKTGGGPFRLLRQNVPANRPLYEPTVDSCIDMMFEGEPPETLPSGAAPPFYCLGRCDDPPIINTK